MSNGGHRHPGSSIPNFRCCVSERSFSPLIVDGRPLHRTQTHTPLLESSQAQLKERSLAASPGLGSTQVSYFLVIRVRRNPAVPQVTSLHWLGKCRGSGPGADAHEEEQDAGPALVPSYVSVYVYVQSGAECNDGNMV